MSQSKSPRKNWCVTSWPLKGAPSIEEFMTEHGPRGTGLIVYAAGQQETTASGGLHYQWWFQLKTKKRFTALVGTQAKHILKSTWCHVEPCRGTEAENEEYVKKSDTGVQGTLYQEGEFTKQGKASEMTEIVEEIKDGADWADLYENHASFIIRGHHSNAIIHAFGYLQPAPQQETFELSSWPQTDGWGQAKAWLEGNRKTTLLLCGPPGCGKTRWAMSLNIDGKPTHLACTLDDLKLLNANHSAVCLDDFDDVLHDMGNSSLTQLFDRQVDVSVKCRFNDARITRNTAMIVCSNHNLEPLLDRHPGLPRRVTLVHVKAWKMPNEEEEAVVEVKSFDEQEANQVAEEEAEDAKNQAHEDLDDEVEEPAPVLVRANAQVWTRHSSQTSSRKRKRSANEELVSTQESELSDD